MNNLKNENIELLKDRIFDALENSDLNNINFTLNNIKNSVILSGVGGSYTVCNFARKVFEIKNNCFSKSLDLRDLFYSNINNYCNLISISYSGKNFGVKLCNDTLIKNKYLFSNDNNNNFKNLVQLSYNTKIKKEKSFVSLATTLIPISILLNYYLSNNNKYDIVDFINKTFNNNIFDKLLNIEFNNLNISIIYGEESSSAAEFLKSTFTEAGLYNTTLSRKYNYCHGQTTLPYHMKNHDLIFFKNGNNELDNTILNESKKIYSNIIILENKIKDGILSDFDFLIKSVFLSYYISKIKNKDLSDVNYYSSVKNLFNFRGSI